MERKDKKKKITKTSRPRDGTIRKSCLPYRPLDVTKTHISQASAHVRGGYPDHSSKRRREKIFKPRTALVACNQLQRRAMSLKKRVGKDSHSA